MRRWAFPAHTRMASSPQSPAPAVATLCGPPATLRAETKGAFASSAAVPGNGAHWRESSVIERSGNAPPLPRLPPVAPQRKAGLPSQPRHSRSSRRARHRRPASHDLKKGSPHATRPCSPLRRLMPAVVVSLLRANTPILSINRRIHPSPQSWHAGCAAPVTPAPARQASIITRTTRALFTRACVRTVLPVRLYNSTTLLLVLPVLCSAVL